MEASGCLLVLKTKLPSQIDGCLLRAGCGLWVVGRVLWTVAKLIEKRGTRMTRLMVTSSVIGI